MTNAWCNSYDGHKQRSTGEAKTARGYSPYGSEREVNVMREVHVMDELKAEPAWAFLYAAFFIGIVVFALMSAGFVG